MVSGPRTSPRSPLATALYSLRLIRLVCHFIRPSVHPSVCPYLHSTVRLSLPHSPLQSTPHFSSSAVSPAWELPQTHYSCACSCAVLCRCGGLLKIRFDSCERAAHFVGPLATGDGFAGLTSRFQQPAGGLWRARRKTRGGPCGGAGRWRAPGNRRTGRVGNLNHAQMEIVNGRKGNCAPEKEIANGRKRKLRAPEKETARTRKGNCNFLFG